MKPPMARATSGTPTRRTQRISERRLRRACRGTDLSGGSSSAALPADFSSAIADRFSLGGLAGLGCVRLGQIAADGGQDLKKLRILRLGDAGLGLAAGLRTHMPKPVEKAMGMVGEIEAIAAPVARPRPALDETGGLQLVDQPD